MRRWTLQIGLATLSLLALPAAAAPPVHEFELDNGLRILVREDHRAPIVVSQLWYKVGSGYEHDGITGASHLLEHMMFKGTDKLEPGEFSRRIAELGGRENAFTGGEYTAYFQTLSREHLEVSMELEADRMRNLRMDATELDRERQVVLEERRLRTEDNPQSLTYEQFKAAAFVASPSRNPVIGWRDDIENLTLDDLNTWYRRWYAPNNATLVVVGDVDADAVLALARKHYGPIPAADVTPPKSRREPAQRGIRRITVRAEAELPFLMMGYKVPGLLDATEDWEAYALEVLAGVLDGGASARLARDLVRGSEIAAGAGAGYSLYTGMPGLLTLSGTPSGGFSIDDLEAALREQITRLQDELVAADELARIKAQVVAGKVYELDSVFYQGMQVGMLETAGIGWQRLDEYMQRVRDVTPEQIREVARKYLLDDGLTIGVLEPVAKDAEVQHGN